jgi:hypothetical protein
MPVVLAVAETSLFTEEAGPASISSADALRTHSIKSPCVSLTVRLLAPCGQGPSAGSSLRSICRHMQGRKHSSQVGADHID